jgi:hypothetical protein
VHDNRFNVSVAIPGDEEFDIAPRVTDPAAELVAYFAQTLTPAAGASSDRRPVYTADLRCLMCTRSVGTVLSTKVPFPPFVAFRPVVGPTQWPFAWRNLRCTECGGNTMLEDVEQYWVYAPVDWLTDRPRRGRPPKRLTERSASPDTSITT